MSVMDAPPARAEPTAPWSAILDAFGLPSATLAPRGVVGGWSHHLWRVETTSGAYAIKELVEPAGDWWMEQLKVAVALEQVAWRAGTVPMAHPIAAECGELVGEVPVANGRRLYRCHRWIEGSPCWDLPPSVAQAASVGKTVAAIADLAITGGTTRENLAWNALDAYEATVDEAEATAQDWASLLVALRPLVEQLRAEFEVLRDRCEPMLVMHRDVDPKNAVHGPDGDVMLVDWDYAGPVLPAGELLTAALSFAGGSAGADAECVTACIEAFAAESRYPVRFTDAAPLIVEESLRWTMVNAWRALGHRGKSEADRTRAADIVRSVAPRLPSEAAAVLRWAERFA